MTKIAALLLGILAASPVSAQTAPVFLTCVLHNKTVGDQQFDVQLNEAANTASYAFSMFGRVNSYAARAVFTPDRVAFNGFTVSRTNLSFQRDNGDFGQCTINKTKRAF